MFTDISRLTRIKNKYTFGQREAYTEVETDEVWEYFECWIFATYTKVRNKEKKHLFFNWKLIL